MGKIKTSLEDIKVNIQDWTGSKVLDNQKQDNIQGGRNINKPWGSLCGGSTPQ